jgi:hypothetical protein
MPVLASIVAMEPPTTQMVAYNLLLGYRGPMVPMPLSGWLRSSVKKPHTSVEVSVERATGQPLLKVQVTEGKSVHRLLWLDPIRGYIPVHFEVNYMNGNVVADYGRELLDEAKQFGNVWVPMKMTQESGTSDPGMTQIKYVVEQFSLDKPALRDMTLQFPPGTQIIDEVRQQGYELQTDGSKKFFEFYNGHTGKTITVEEQQAAATQPTTRPATRSAAPPAAKPAGK